MSEGDVLPQNITGHSWFGASAIIALLKMALYSICNKKKMLLFTSVNQLPLKCRIVQVGIFKDYLM